MISGEVISEVSVQAASAKSQSSTHSKRATYYTHCTCSTYSTHASCTTHAADSTHATFAACSTHATHATYATLCLLCLLYLRYSLYSLEVGGGIHVQGNASLLLNASVLDANVAEVRRRVLVATFPCGCLVAVRWCVRVVPCVLFRLRSGGGRAEHHRRHNRFYQRLIRRKRRVARQE